MWHRYVAIGDSFTEGMVDADPLRDNAFRGWADYLAEALHERAGGEFGYANLAVRGRLLSDVVGPQLDQALAMEPDLVSIVGGGNDLLRPSVDLDGLADRLRAAVVQIRATGADVLLATPTDTAKAGVFKALRGRHAIHAANLWTIAQDTGAHVVNLWGMRSLQDWRMWGEDRIHLTTEGHRRVSRAALLALGVPDVDEGWRELLPETNAPGRREQLVQSRDWARSYAGPWVQRRLRGESSGDRLDAKRPLLQPISPPDEV